MDKGRFYAWVILVLALAVGLGGCVTPMRKEYHGKDPKSVNMKFRIPYWREMEVLDRNHKIFKLENGQRCMEVWVKARNNTTDNMKLVIGAEFYGHMEEVLWEYGKGGFKLPAKSTREYRLEFPFDAEILNYISNIKVYAYKYYWDLTDCIRVAMNGVIPNTF